MMRRKMPIARGTDSGWRTGVALGDGEHVYSHPARKLPCTTFEPRGVRSGFLGHYISAGRVRAVRLPTISIRPPPALWPNAVCTTLAALVLVVCRAAYRHCHASPSDNTLALRTRLSLFITPHTPSSNVKRNEAAGIAGTHLLPSRVRIQRARAAHTSDEEVLAG